MADDGWITPPEDHPVAGADDGWVTPPENHPTAEPSGAQQWAKDISTVRPDQSASIFGTPVSKRGSTYGETLDQYYNAAGQKLKEAAHGLMEGTDPTKAHGPMDTARMLGHLAEGASGLASGVAAPLTAAVNPAWEYLTGIPGEKAVGALGAPVKGAGVLNLRPRPVVPEASVPPRGSNLALPGTLQRPPQVDMAELERSIAAPQPTAPQATQPVAAASDRPPNLLPPETPHDMPSGRASVGAAGDENPLTGYSPETIAKLQSDLKQAFPTPHLLEQAIEERSAHHMLGELDPALESKMGGLATHTGPERTEIVNSVMQRGAEAKVRMRSAFDRAFGEYQDREQLGRVLEIQRNKQTGPFWDDFKATVIPPTAPLQAIIPRLNAAGALQAANKALRVEGLPQVKQWAGAGGKPIEMPTATAYQYAKEHLDDLIEASLARPGGANQARRYTQLKNDLVNAIDNHPDPGVAGLWKAARDTYAKPTQIIKAMKLGERVLTGHISAEELPFMTASLGPDEMRALQVGMRGHLEDTFGRPGPQGRRLINTVLAPSNQSKLRWALGEDKADALVSAIEHEDSMHDAPTRIIRGSPTAARVTAQREWGAPASALEEIVGEIPGAMMKPGKAAGKLAAKTLFRRRAAQAEAQAARVREEAARAYTLQGPERDAMARALIGSPEGHNVVSMAGAARTAAVPVPLTAPAATPYRRAVPVSPGSAAPQSATAAPHWTPLTNDQTRALSTPPAKAMPAVRAAPVARPDKELSLMQFLASRGGLKETPDLRSIFDGNPLVPGYGRLFRKDGLTTDQAWEHALEGKYLFEPSHEPGIDRPVETGWNDILDMLAKEARGQKQYPMGYLRGPEREDAAHREYLVHSAVDHAFEQEGLPTLTGTLRDRVVKMVDREGITDPLEAYERAVMEEHYVGRDIPIPGVPKDLPGWDIPHEPGAAPARGHGPASAQRHEGQGTGEASRHPGEGHRGEDEGKGINPPPFATGGRLPLSTRKASNYAPTGGKPDHHCGPAPGKWEHGYCAHFKGPHGCSLVGGFIAARGECDWWAAARAAGGRAMSAGGLPDDIQPEVDPDQPQTIGTSRGASYGDGEASQPGTIDKLLGRGTERYQLWPERLVRGIAEGVSSGVTAPRDALTGRMPITDPETGMPTREAMGRGAEFAGSVMGTGFPFAEKGALGMAGGMPTYSGAGAAAREAKLQVGTPSQWLGYLKNQPGVKPTELEHIGLEPWLKSQQGKLTREQINQYIESKQPELREVRKGPEFPGTRPQYGEYQLPGGSNYGETLLTLPDRSPAQLLREEAQRRGYGDRIMDWPDQEFAQQYRDKVTNATDTGTYKSSHWDEPNVLLHVRHNDRTVPGPNGEPMNALHLEEVQSDWGQLHRKVQQQISDHVDKNFDDLAAKMVKAGVIKKVCD